MSTGVSYRRRTATLIALSRSAGCSETWHAAASSQVTPPSRSGAKLASWCLAYRLSLTHPAGALASANGTPMRRLKLYRMQQLRRRRTSAAPKLTFRSPTCPHLHHARCQLRVHRHRRHYPHATPPPRAACVPQQQRVKLLKALRAAEGAVAEALGGVAAANRERDKAKAAWEHALQENSNPRRTAQISDDRWGPHGGRGRRESPLDCRSFRLQPCHIQSR